NDNTPAITSGSVFSVTENTTAVTTVTASDADQPGQTLTYSLVGGADVARFAIDAVTGALSFQTAPDHEAPSDAGADNVYDVTVQVSDGSLSATQAVAVTVTGVNDNAPRFSAQAGGGAELLVSVPEGERWSMVLEAADADLPGQALTFGISGGADAALFELDPDSGLLAFKLTADHEVPQDANLDNVYEVAVDVRDGELTGHTTVTLRVTNLNEAPVLVKSQVAVDQGGRVVLDSDMLRASDTDTDAAALVFTVSDVQSGVFERADAPGQAVSQFTQADVVAGRVVFVQSGTGAAAASFGLTVSDGGWTVGPRRVVVQVQPSAVVPQPEVILVPAVELDMRPVAGAGVDVGAPLLRSSEPLTGVGEGTRLDRILVEIAGSRVAGQPILTSLATTDRDNEAAPASGSPDRPSASARAPAAMPALQTPLHGLRQAAAQSVSANPPDSSRQTASELLVMLDVPIDLSGFVQDRMALLQWALADERSRAAADSALQQQAKDEAPALRWDSRQAAQIGSMALSVGLVFWATRATGLVASLLAVAPPWRQFDPLPVLSVHAPRQPEGTEVEWLDTDITGSLAELAEDILDQRT
uniref:cadherin-like domain-containing protein n=1 Tax=Sphaerotilus sp. TaxID=2093942 RepID=UPI00286DFB88